MRLRALLFRGLLGTLVIAAASCADNKAKVDPPTSAVQKLIVSYDQKNVSAYLGAFSGDYSYEFSQQSDSVLVRQYVYGWFKTDETRSATHLFNGYTWQGRTLPGATAIDIHFGSETPVSDNSPGVDPTTHKLLATRVDGTITIPQPGAQPTTLLINNNYEVIYLVRGDKAVLLDSTQPADSMHWYIDRWVDLTQAQTGSSTSSVTWGALRASYR